MAKFCGKCGSRLDEKTGACPKCDAGLPGHFCVKLVAIMLLLGVFAAGAAGMLVYFQVIDIPVISLILEKNGLKKRIVIEIDPMKDNYIPEEEAIAFDENSNLFYANNELLVIFSLDAEEKQKEEVAAYLDGEIAGTIPGLNLCQIRMEGKSTLEELTHMADEIMQEFETVLYATYDTAAVNCMSYIPNDPWRGDLQRKDWEDSAVDAGQSNWWFKAINAHKAWDYKELFSPISIGICDGAFDTKHEEFKNKVSFPNKLLERRNKAAQSVNEHGTFVAGIIGAEGDNRKGITGIVQNCKLLLAPYTEDKNIEKDFAWDSSTYANLNYLVKAGAKVLNFSQSKTGLLAENETCFSDEMIEREGILAALVIGQLIASGEEDFLIVQSAGNGNDKVHKATDAIQGGWFASITDATVECARISIKEIRSHVIIVGAAEKTADGFQCTSFSNYGEQVDLCAPGGDSQIYTTKPRSLSHGEIFGGYDMAGGTSMSAPMVTGVCALTWSANPDLSAGEVKRIVCTNSRIKVKANPETPCKCSYNMVDAELSVEAALNYGISVQPGEAEPFHNERDIVLVLDTSGSMGGDPIQETEKAAEKFIDTIAEEQACIGIAAYDSEARRISGFSMNKEQLSEQIAEISTGGDTDIEAGLAEACAMLQYSVSPKKIIVLMSDGEPNSGKQGEELIAYADKIKEEGILIYTLGFFANLGENKATAQYLMEKIASDGCHYEVSSADDLVFFFEDMADQINGQNYIYIRIACPVDVSVAYGGEELNSAEEKLSTRTAFGTLTFEETEEMNSEEPADRIKVLRLKEGIDYPVQIVGTGRGMMNYTIGFMDENGDYTDFRRFEKIKITRKTVIDTVAAVSEESVLNIDENGDGWYDLRMRAKQNEYGKEVRFPIMFYFAGGAILFPAFIIFVCWKIRKKRR